MPLAYNSWFSCRMCRLPTSKPRLLHLQTQSSMSRPMSSMAPEIRLAVLHQAIEPPIINGIRKPMKPGGYQDSSADIAYTLSHSQNSNIKLHTPLPSPSPGDQAHWSFPDTPSGIRSALQNGTTHLWANTILFASHPLQTLPALDAYQDTLRIIGQPPKLVEAGDDKARVNDFLRSYSAAGSRTGDESERFTLPRGWTVNISPDVDLHTTLKQLDLPYPVVGKPIRGRGSFGVKVCQDLHSLATHLSSLAKDSPSVMIEEYLSGEEATVTVMPPSSSRTRHWALPIVTRFGHQEGVAPYNGTVAVSANSRVIGRERFEADGAYWEVMRECEGVARLLGAMAPIRIDVRRFGRGKEKENGNKFALFDVNLKPNMTGPGRPGRDDQASLTALAAQSLGWDYERLLREMIESAPTLRALREVQLLL